MDDLKNFLNKFKGAIIGAIIAIILIILKLDRFIIGLTIIMIGIFLGNYVQRNKVKVKNVLQKLIDKM